MAVSECPAGAVERVGEVAAAEVVLQGEGLVVRRRRPGDDAAGPRRRRAGGKSGGRSRSRAADVARE